MKYEDVKHCLTTGDKVLFAGTGFISGLIRWVTKSEITHVGVVIKMFNRLVLLESTSLNGSKDGVQLNVLSDRIKNYKGKKYIRHLLNRRPKVDSNMIISEFLTNHLGKRYERNLLQLLRSATIGVNKKEDWNSFFCSELAAAFDIMVLGILPPDPVSSEYTPADYLPGHAVDKRMNALAFFRDVDIPEWFPAPEYSDMIEVE